MVIRPRCRLTFRKYPYLRLDQDEIDEQNHKIMLDVLVGEALTIGTLSQADSFPQRAVVGLAVDGVQVFHRSAAGDAYWHVEFMPVSTF